MNIDEHLNQHLGKKIHVIAQQYIIRAVNVMSK